jgi:preprotein translocase subunit SecG
MVLVVLMQRPRSEGLGAAFGGGMTDNLFGAQTTHVLQKFTVYLGVGFFALTLLLAILFSRATAGSTLIERELLSGEAAPAAEKSEATATATPAAETTPETLAETIVVEESTVPVPTENTTGSLSAEPTPAVEQAASSDAASVPTPAEQP